MALTSQQIVTLALQIAKAPGFTSQAGMMLNSILQEMAQNYDLDVARGVVRFNFQPGLTDGIVLAGCGPYPLPADYLRAEPNDVFWTLQGVPYKLIPIDFSEFDGAVQQAGINAYPYWFATDMSQSPPVAYIYPPPSGAFPVTVRYRRQMADIAAPETSATIPWFPNTNYLITRLAGEMMKITDDDRASAYLGDGPSGAQGILDRYLKLEGDREDRTRSVMLDRRHFKGMPSGLRNTKTIGW